MMLLIMMVMMTTMMVVVVLAEVKLLAEMVTYDASCVPFDGFKVFDVIILQRRTAPISIPVPMRMPMPLNKAVNTK